MTGEASVPGLVDTDGELPPLGPIDLGLNAMETRAAELERKQAGYVDSELGRLQAVADSLKNLIDGSIESKLKDMEYKAGVLVAKQQKHLNRQLGNLYNHAFPFGIVYPTNEQAVYGLTTGDTFGSMGLAHPTPPVRPTAHAAGPVATVGPTDAVGTTLSVPGVQPPAADAPVVDPFPGFGGGGGGRLNPGFTPPPPGPVPPGPGPFPPPAAPPPFNPPPSTLPCDRYAYPTPPGVNAPWGVNWEGVPCSHPSLCGTTQDPCGCPPGVHWGGPFIGCPTTPGTGPPGTPSCPPPVIQVNCCNCNQPPSAPAGPSCPPGSHWVPDPADPSNPTLRGGGGSDPSSPTLRGGGGGDLPGLMGGGSSTLRGGGGGPVLTRRTPSAAPCPPVHPLEGNQLFPGQPQIAPGGGFWVCWPWSVGAPEPPYVTAHTECLDGSIFDPPQPGPVCYRLWDGYDLYFKADGSELIGLAGPRPGWVRGSDWCAASAAAGGGAAGPGPGQCVADPPGRCPPKPVLGCGPDLNPDAKQLALGTGDECKAIQEVIDRLGATVPRFDDWLGMQTEEPGREPTIDEKVLSYLVTGTSSPILPQLLNRLAGWLQSTVLGAANAIGIDSPELLKTCIWRGILRLINHWTGAIPHQLLIELDQISNTLHPSRLPTSADADRAYLGDAITAEEWECWVKAHGDHPDPRKRVRFAERKRLSAHQALMTYRRGLIDQAAYEKRLREDGVLTDPDKAELEAWENYFPAIGEGFRWGGRQLFDQDVRDRFGLDQGFEDLWESAFKDVADAHGLSRTWAQLHWAAHWKHPGESVLIEAVRRLRPDKVDKDVAFTEADLDAALRQEGYPDYWIKRIKALAYHKPTRLDVRRLYQLHQIDEDGLRERLQDMGFEKEYANDLVKMWETDRRLKEYHQAGFPAGAGLVNGYARGEITKAELGELAERQSYYGDQADEIKEAAELARRRAGRRAAIAGVKGRYTAGLIGAAEAAAELAGEGIDADEIESLMKYWDQVKKRHPKQVQAATLCQWRKDQLITAFEQMEALLRLGYNQPDARNIVADCTLKIAQAQSKSQQQAEAQAQRAAERSAKTAAKNARAKARGARTRTPSGQAGRPGGAAGP